MSIFFRIFDDQLVLPDHRCDCFAIASDDFEFHAGTSLLLFPAGSPHLAIQDICQGAHDGVVLALILKQGAVGLLGFHIAGLRGIAECLREDAFGEDLRIG